MSISENVVKVIESFYFVSGGMNAVLQCISSEPVINTVLSNEKGEQWNVSSITYDKYIEKKCKEKGIENVIIVGLDPIGHKGLPTNGINLYVTPLDK
jgi:hypothetical protein